MSKYHPIRECAACGRTHRAPRPGVPYAFESPMLGIYVYIYSRPGGKRRLAMARRICICSDCMDGSIQAGQVTDLGRKIADIILRGTKSRYNELAGVRTA